MLHARDNSDDAGAIYPVSTTSSSSSHSPIHDYSHKNSLIFPQHPSLASVQPATPIPKTPWSLRCFPILTFYGICLLNFAALGTPLDWVLSSRQSGMEIPSPSSRRQFFQNIYASYLTLMHLFAFLAACRLCWVTFAVTKAVSATRARCAALTRPKYAGSGQVVHAIIVPSYKEDFDTLRSTLAVLASHSAAQQDYHVVLAMEERDEGAQHTVVELQKVFYNSFLQLSSTTHPAGIPGEVAGKASNVNWAAKEFVHRLAYLHSQQDVIFTVMDADTHFLSDYFASITFSHLDRTPAEAATQLYAPPLVFDRNASKVPAFVRVADVVWSGAGLSGFHPQSTICIPTSAYSVPMPLVQAVGGWDAGPEAIGEDMHMYLKTFFSTRGRLRVVPIYAPASCSNVSSSLPGWAGFSDGLHQRWRQSIRHMWGSMDTGYALHRGIMLLRDRHGNEVLPEPTKTVVDGTPSERSGWLTYVLLYHRLFEAHCLPMHLTLCIIISIIYSSVVPAEHISPMLNDLFYWADKWRIISFLLMATWMFLYNKYHGLSVRLREAETRLSGLYDEDDFAHRDSWRMQLDIFFFPLAGFLFSIPGLIAQTSHLWTTKLEYRVSSKPIRERSKIVAALGV